MNEKTELEYNLKFSKEYFEEIYFRENGGSYFFHKKIKSLFIITSILLIFTVVGAVYSLTVEVLPLIVFVFLMFIVSLIIYLNTFLGIYEYKKGIYEYLKDLEKYKDFKLGISNNYIFLIQDDKETFESWDSFITIEINNSYIALEGKINFLIPAKSLNSTADYKELKENISLKLKEI